MIADVSVHLQKYAFSRNSGIFALDHTGNEATMLHTLCEPDTAATSEME